MPAVPEVGPAPASRLARVLARLSIASAQGPARAHPKLATKYAQQAKITDFASICCPDVWKYGRLGRACQRPESHFGCTL
jgi:hypothetical protein